MKSSEMLTILDSSDALCLVEFVVGKTTNPAKVLLWHKNGKCMMKTGLLPDQWQAGCVRYPVLRDLVYFTETKMLFAGMELELGDEFASFPFNGDIRKYAKFHRGRRVSAEIREGVARGDVIPVTTLGHLTAYAESDEVKVLPDLVRMNANQYWGAVLPEREGVALHNPGSYGVSDSGVEAYWVTWCLAHTGVFFGGRAVRVFSGPDVTPGLHWTLVLCGERLGTLVATDHPCGHLLLNGERVSVGNGYWVELNEQFPTVVRSNGKDGVPYHFPRPVREWEELPERDARALKNLMVPDGPPGFYDFMVKRFPWHAC
jgi:hypothetical protein